MRWENCNQAGALNKRYESVISLGASTILLKFKREILQLL